ncbi:hypothetical protein AVEN_82282-1 [Araneus ventricosus]|uniref:Uncharacterized protein n=1 Tax=Araneus ventricosus TaxID=182803 RepID=A0A4Y2VDE0_ARAVE|nr:hypothetical protein AVEN_82282-1 [Araneus ventricosus]
MVCGAPSLYPHTKVHQAGMWIYHHPYIHIPKSIKLVCGYTTIRISTYQSPSSWHVDIPPSVFGMWIYHHPYLICGYTTIRIWYVDIPPSVYPHTKVHLSNLLLFRVTLLT